MPSEVRKAAAWGIDGEGPARATVFPRAERRMQRGAGYEEVQTELRSWPYAWRHVEIDCSELGAAHRRKRLLWVGVRLD